MTIGASHEAKGSLTLVGTPIGNRADLSSRGLEALHQADTVLAEDTRVSGKLLSSLGVEARLERCDENVMAAMMVARSFGMWICARRPGRTTEQVKSDLNLHPAKLVRIMMKGGLQ